MSEGTTTPTVSIILFQREREKETYAVRNMAVMGFCSLDRTSLSRDWRLRRTSWLLTKNAFDSSSNSVAERWLHGSSEREKRHVQQLDPRSTGEVPLLSLTKPIKVSFITVCWREWLDRSPLERWFMSWAESFDIKQRWSLCWWHADFVWQKWNDIILHHKSTRTSRKSVKMIAGLIR